MDENALPKEAEQKPKQIETEEEFWRAIEDARNQFSDTDWSIYRLRPEKLVEGNKKMRQLSFLDYIREYNLVLSPKILANEYCRRLISQYDELIERIRNLNSTEEYIQIMEESREFFRRFKIGL